MKVAELFAEFRVKTDKFRRELAEAQSSVRENASSMQSAIAKAARRITSSFAGIAKAARRGALGVAAAAGAIGAAFFKVNDELARTITQAQRIGAQPRTLQALQEVFRSLGEDPADAAEALAELNLKIGEALDDPNSDPAQAFKSLGLSVKELARLNPAEQLLAVFDAFSKIANVTLQGDLAERVFSSEGRRILGALREGDEALRRGARAASRGGLLEGDAIDKVLRAREAFGELRRSFRELSTELAIRIAPAITAIVDGLTRAVRAPGEFFAALIRIAKGVIQFVENAMLRVAEKIGRAVQQAIDPEGFASPEAARARARNDAAIAIGRTNAIAQIARGIQSARGQFPGISRPAGASGPGGRGGDDFLPATPSAGRQGGGGFLGRLRDSVGKIGDRIGDAARARIGRIAGIGAAIAAVIRKAIGEGQAGKPGIGAASSTIQTAFGGIEVQQQIRLLEGIETNTFETRIALQRFAGALT